MTISTESIKAGPFNGNDTATSFAFTFKTFAKADLVVTKTSTAGVDTVLTLDSDYSVTLNADQNDNPGGSVTYPISGSPLATGEKLTITNEPAYKQLTDLINGGGFFPQVIEDAMDRVTVLAQRLKELTARSLFISKTSTVALTDPSVPEPSVGKFLRWNSAGKALENVDLATVSSTAAGVDETDTDVTKDKLVSNNLAKGWEDFKKLLTTRGDMLYRDASGNARLGKGVENQLLGIGTNDPAWTNFLIPTAGSASMAIVHTDQRKLFLLNSGDDTTPTLPAITSAMDGMIVGFKALDTTGFTITTDGANKFSVNAATTLKLSYADEYVVLMARYDATAADARWDVISENRFVGFFARDGTGGTSVPHSTSTKITCEDEVYDPQGDYDNATNFRYTPREPGKYLVGLFAQNDTGVAVDTLLVAQVKRNGSGTPRVGRAFVNTVTGNASIERADIFDMNGTTDYLELFAQHNSGTTETMSGEFWAVKIK